MINRQYGCSFKVFLAFKGFYFNVMFFPVIRRLPDFKQRIGGQSVPIEDFAIHKAKKYFDKNGCLFLPGLVIIIVVIFFGTFFDLSEISLEI